MLSEYLSLQPWHLDSSSEGSQTEPWPTRAGQRCWVHLLGVLMPLLSLGGGPPASRFTGQPRVSYQGQEWEKAAATPHPAPLSSRPEATRPVGPIQAPPLSLSLTQSWWTPRLLYKWGPSKWESMSVLMKSYSHRHGDPSSPLSPARKQVGRTLRLSGWGAPCKEGRRTTCLDPRTHTRDPHSGHRTPVGFTGSKSDRNAASCPTAGDHTPPSWPNSSG